MSIFGTFDVGQSGMSMSQTWLNTIANNIANADTVNPAGKAPFRQQFVEVQEIPPALGGNGIGGGVAVTGLLADASTPAVAQSPGNPLADANGNITLPVVDLAGQMTDMMVAERSFQANETTIETAKALYTSALQIGR